MMNPKHLNIALASDTNYAGFVSVLLVSLFENNQEFDFVSVYLLSNGIKELQISEICSHIPQGLGEVVVCDISNIRQRLSVDVPPTISITAYSRLFVASLVPDSVDRILYMDVDAIVTGSLYKLWNLEQKDFLVAGVLDDVSQYAKKTIGLPLTSPYINSGFLLINLSLWRERNIEKEILDFLISHGGSVYHHDQGLINAICRDRIHILPINYNMVTNFFVFPYKSFKQTPFYSKEEFDEGLVHPVFLHFTAGVAGRPWMKGCKHPMRHCFIDYLEKTKQAHIDIREDDRPLRLRFLAFLFYKARPLYYLVLKMRSFFKE